MSKNLKSLFITLPQRDKPDNFPPYGPLAVITALRKAGYIESTLYNLDVLRPTRQEALDYIVSVRPDILGISAPVSTSYENCKFFSTEVKRLLPGTIIILGGNMAASAEIILKKTGVDFCVLGEGEEVCCQLFDKLSGGEQRSAFCNIKGLAFLDGDRMVITGYAEQLPKERIYDVDWNICDRASVENYFPRIKDIVKTSAYYKYFFPYDGDSNDFVKEDISNKTVGVISCSKGCIGRCTFCHRFTAGLRIVPVEIIIARIKELISRFNVGAIAFADECFGANALWLRKFCEMIKPLKIRWKVGGMRVDMVTPELIEVMKDAGCRTIIYGMETGSKRMLEVMEKKVSLNKNYNAVKWTVEAGVFTTPVLVLGMPGETSETIKETASFIAYSKTINSYQNPRDISITFAQALPGTPLYEYARSIGKIGSTIDEEEKYLYEISNRNASDETTTLNLTGYPKLVYFSWHLFIRVIVNHEVVRKFGIRQFHEIVFHNGEKPSLIELLRNRKVNEVIYLYPRLIYRLRHFLWGIVFVKSLKRHGAVKSLELLAEYVSFALPGLLSARPKSIFKYKSLRKIMENDLGNSYSGSKEMISLRKGR